MKILIEKDSVSMTGFDKEEILKGLTTYIKTLKNLGISIDEIYLATKEGFEYEKEFTNPILKKLFKILGLED